MPMKMSRLLCLLVISTLICALLPALAEETEVYVYTYILKIYEQPNKKSELLAQVPFARQLTRTGEKKGWAQVITPDGETGYCSAGQLTEKNPNTHDETIYSQQDRAPVYQCPSLDAPMIGHLDRNGRAKLIAMTPMGDWLRIQYSGHDGYIQRPRVDFKKFSKGKAAVVSADSLPVYYDPDIDSTFGTLQKGQKLAVVSVTDGWAKIRSGSGLIGYCKADGLSSGKAK